MRQFIEWSAADSARYPAKAKQKLGWEPEISVEQMCHERVAEDLKQAKQHAFLQRHGYDVTIATEK
ncbi:hypothetical protein D5085_02505 [Ectothiorhodospiraceae bacterium BW-2]|nr:hypothetical protein D5085_02505 [Ectothiorhodospiraceae bacterium BW-2]